MTFHIGFRRAVGRRERCDGFRRERVPIERLRPGLVKVGIIEQSRERGCVHVSRTSELASVIERSAATGAYPIVHERVAGTAVTRVQPLAIDERHIGNATDVQHGNRLGER